MPIDRYGAKRKRDDEAVGRETVALADYDEGRLNLDKTLARLIHATVVHGNKPKVLRIELLDDFPDESYSEPDPITRYWLDHYIGDAHGLCSLCGNTGRIDTRTTAISAAGWAAGRINYCICPNGREMRKAALAGKEP